MSRRQSERDQQTIGRYEVFMHGQDVVMFHTGLDSVRTLKPAEALMLLEWLNQHQEDLYKTAKEEEGKLAETWDHDSDCSDLSKRE
jgi:hypothetical protein